MAVIIGPYSINPFVVPRNYNGSFLEIKNALKYVEKNAIFNNFLITDRLHSDNSNLNELLQESNRSELVVQPENMIFLVGRIVTNAISYVDSFKVINIQKHISLDNRDILNNLLDQFSKRKSELEKSKHVYRSKPLYSGLIGSKPMLDEEPLDSNESFFEDRYQGESFTGTNVPQNIGHPLSISERGRSNVYLHPDNRQIPDIE